MAIGKLTQVFKNGMVSAPLPGAVTTSTSCADSEDVMRCFRIEDTTESSSNV